MRMNAAFMRADSPARRTSAPSASANPPPEAAPCTQAMIGCGARRISRTSSAMRRCARNPAATPRAFAVILAVALLEIEPGAERAPRAPQHDDARLPIFGEGR